MARIAGVDIPRDKRVEVSLTYIYGVGPTRARAILAQTGVNPDIRVKDELRWLKPVYPGDTLRVETEIIEKRASQSRPEMGSFRSKVTVFNQDDVAVMTFTSIGLIRTRPADGSDA